MFFPGPVLPGGPKEAEIGKAWGAKGYAGLVGVPWEISASQLRAEAWGQAEEPLARPGRGSL